MKRCSVYIWNSPATTEGRRAKRDQLAAIGCGAVLLKACGDDGTAWQGNQHAPGDVWPQWLDDAYLADYAPLEVYPWSYPWPRQSDQQAIVHALQVRRSDVFILNPESEWRWQNSNVNPWNSLAEANQAARQWMQELKQLCRDTLGYVPAFGISSCPSWVDFPYEGFIAECDFALPEHYFPDSVMAHGENMVEAHVRRAGADYPCIPVVTACGEYDDAGVVALGQSALLALPHPAGFSAWEAGNDSFQSAAVRQVYALLPAETVEAETVVPEGEIVASYVDKPGPGVTNGIDERGEPFTVIKWGGQMTHIDGVNLADIGISGAGMDGAMYDRSIQGGQFQDYVRREAPGK